MFVEYCLLEHRHSVFNAFLQECRKRSQHLERLRQETEEKLSEANNESLQVFFQFFCETENLNNLLLLIKSNFERIPPSVSDFQ